MGCGLRADMRSGDHENHSGFLLRIVGSFQKVACRCMDNIVGHGFIAGGASQVCSSLLAVLRTKNGSLVRTPRPPTKSKN